MNLTATSTFYPKTRYGTESGPLVACKIVSPIVPPLFSIRHKSVIFVVDISASMSETLPHVKSSLLAFRRVLFPDSSSPEAKAWKTNIKIVTFSNEAKLLWDCSSSKTFEEAISRLQVQDCTNMGAGIELAYTLVDPAKVTWIVVLTDGVSNKGVHQTPESFKALASRAPFSSRLLTIGYGEDFDAEILNSIGDFTHLESSEQIPILMGALAHEVSTASMFNVFIDTPNEYVFGQSSVGVLSNERTFLAGFLPSKNVDYTKISLKYFEINEECIEPRILNVCQALDTSEQVSSDISREFYRCTAAKLINDLYDKPSRTKIDRAKSVVSGWTDILAEEDKQKVLRIIRKMLKVGPQETSNQAMFYAASALKQASYVLDEFSTPSSIKAGKMASQLVSDEVCTPPRRYDASTIPATPRKVCKPNFFAEAASFLN